MKKTVLVLVLLLATIGEAKASDIEELAREGYAVVEETQVDGDFEGCDFEKRIQFMNGLIFVCSEYNYSYSYMPDVLILQNIRSRDFKVIIDDEEYDGTLYKRR